MRYFFLRNLPTVSGDDYIDDTEVLNTIEEAKAYLQACLDDKGEIGCNIACNPGWLGNILYALEANNESFEFRRAVKCVIECGTFTENLLTHHYDFSMPSTDLCACKYFDTKMDNTHPDVFIIRAAELLNNE